jgi:hypothetical protein
LNTVSTQKRKYELKARADAQQATAFVTEAVEALMYLGCDVQAS